MPNNKIIIYLYNRLHDPLIQSNLFLYIKEIGKKGIYSFAVVTYEDPDFPVSTQQKEEAEKLFKEINATWIPLTWTRGQSITKKMGNLKAGFSIIRKLKKDGYKNIVSLGTVAGSFAYIYAKLMGLNLYLYQYEPHSEYTLDVGYWKESSLGFKILNSLEKKSAHFAKVISSGTRHMQERLERWQTKASFFKIPSVVNQKKFFYSDKHRNIIRDRYDIPRDAEVILYAGKYGGLYFYEENPLMFKYLREHNPNFHILIVTLNPIEEIRGLFEKHGVTKNLTVTSSSYEDIDKYLCAADFGIVSVESGPSKKFVSNIKVGEYLSCGLPYLICRGISEDDWYAEHRGVGVVVKDFSKEEIDKAYPQIQAYLDKPASELKSHCRQVGVDYRGFVNLYPRFEKALETLCKN